MNPETKYAHYSDETLLQSIAQRDDAALGALYDRHAQIVFNVLVRIVRDTNVADELLQETFWQVWQKAQNFQGQGAAAAWLYRIARNKALDQLRRQKVRPQPATALEEQTVDETQPNPSQENPVEYATDRALLQNQVQHALRALPVEQRQCLELAYFEGMSQQQIAEHTRTPLGTVKTRLRMGLEKLERLMTAAGYTAKDVNV